MHTPWHPLSALIIPDFRMFATPGMIRTLLNARTPVDLLYAGDAMWPRIRHSQTVQIDSLPDGALRRGAVVVACPSNAPELLRVVGDRDGAVRLAADAAPGEFVDVGRHQVLARALIPSRSTTGPGRTLRRFWLDCREALAETQAESTEAAESIKYKYTIQAPFYSHTVDRDLEPGLLRRIVSHVPAGGRILVLGSGNGYDCIALAKRGYQPIGVDFVPAMIEIANKEARRRGLGIEFRLSDIRTHQEPADALDAVLFTHEVYSFIPTREERIDLLRRMRASIKPSGVILFSARVIRNPYDRFLLTLHWVLRDLQKRRPWGHSHTRWITPDGVLNRSFIQLFSEASLRKELNAAGFSLPPFEGGHTVLACSPSPEV